MCRQRAATGRSSSAVERLIWHGRRCSKQRGLGYHRGGRAAHSVPARAQATPPASPSAARSPMNGSQRQPAVAQPLLPLPVGSGRGVL